MSTETETKWADPEDYGGEPICVRCGRDATGTKWPICAELVVPASPPSIRHEVHQLTCARYWDGSDTWLCSECDAIVVGDGEAQS